MRRKAYAPFVVWNSAMRIVLSIALLFAVVPACTCAEEPPKLERSKDPVKLDRPKFHPRLPKRVTPDLARTDAGANPQ